jgi:hypothetical protein
LLQIKKKKLASMAEREQCPHYAKHMSAIEQDEIIKRAQEIAEGRKARLRWP